MQKLQHTQPGVSAQQQQKLKVPNPVTPSQLASAKQQLADLATLERQTELHREAGFDTSEAERTQAALKAKLKAFIAVYGNPDNFT